MAYLISATKVKETLCSVTYKIEGSQKQVVLMKATNNVYYNGDLITDRFSKDVRVIAIKLKQVTDEFPDTVTWAS